MVAGVAVRAVVDLQQVAVVLLVPLHGDRPGRRRHHPGEPLELLLVGEILAVGAGGDQRLDDLARVAATLDHLQQLLVADHPLQELLEIRAGCLGAGRFEPHDTRFGGAPDQIRFEIALVLDVGFRLAPLHAEQRRLRDVDVAALDQRG